MKGRLHFRVNLPHGCDQVRGGLVRSYSVLDEVSVKEKEVVNTEQTMYQWIFRFKIYVISELIYVILEPLYTLVY